MKLFFVFVAIVTGVLSIGYRAHKDDKRLTAECEAAGGVLVEARSPLHVCVRTAQTVAGEQK